MRRDQQRFLDALDALDSIAKMIAGRGETDFLGDEVLCAAVAHRPTVLGEAAARISPEIKQRYPLVPWPDIVGLRNVLIHEYFGIHWPFVWQTANDHAPKLRLQLAEILAAEFPE